MSRVTFFRQRLLDHNETPTINMSQFPISAMQLSKPVEQLPGVDRQRAEQLLRLGVARGVDLLFLFPRSYEQPAPMTTSDQFTDQSRVSFVGQIVETAEKVTQSGKHMLGVQVHAEGGGCVRLLWFNQPFRTKMYHVGDRLLITGLLKTTGLNWEMIQPQTAPVGIDEFVADRPLPIYPLTEGLKQPSLRVLMRQLLPAMIAQVEEVLPEAIRERLKVIGIQQALQDIHFPVNMQQALQAQRRFKLQELLVLQLALAMQRKQRERTMQAPVCEPSGKIHSRILNRLGHVLTTDQVSAIDQIGKDMSRTFPMNRLLQGDVGSGKTLVAQYAMLLCVAHEYQAALMAPTEVLARQHALNLERNLAHSRVRVGLLTGSLARRQRNELEQQIAEGHVDLVVGTQALLSDKLQFSRLGLVIFDEQHKFGVLQRAGMRRDGLQPHYLILSATPIPRTIAMTAFGDLDVSTIRTKPPGRAQQHTYLCTTDQLNSWWQFVDRQVALGRQAYVIAPRVAEIAEGETIASAEGTFRMLKDGPFRHLRLGLLHGRLPPEEKEAVLDQFSAGHIDILVSTTVVEVGIDVANATVITILDADRLGLAQLHQLRGRIARGGHTGYACAVASAHCLPGENQRLQALLNCQDGFELAEMDLRQRGPGDLLGVSQTGLPALRMANLVEDVELMELARVVSREILESDPEMADPQLSRLVNQTLRRYGKSLQLGDVG